MPETGNKVMRLRVGVTGESGFIGRHLTGILRVSPAFELVPFRREMFDDSALLPDFVRQCDAVVHLAGVSRSADSDFMYQTNVNLTRKLAVAAEAAGNHPLLCLGSTTHEKRELPYHASKRESRRILEELSDRAGVPCLTLLMANTYGPYSQPFYNSVVSTFCSLAARGETPEQINDAKLELIYVQDLCRTILQTLQCPPAESVQVIAAEEWIALPELWRLLTSWKKAAGDFPTLHNRMEAHLFETFSSYLQ